jgi:hypothetical protein
MSGANQLVIALKYKIIITHRGWYAIRILDIHRGCILHIEFDKKKKVNFFENFYKNVLTLILIFLIDKGT